MGVLNVTPNSFSDGGRYFDTASAMTHADGSLATSDIIDIGGESTGPGAAPVPAEVELARVLPLVQTISERRRVSVDTYKAVVARRCLEAGAFMVNDVSALRGDPDMCSVVRDFHAQVVLMFCKERGSLPHVSDEDRVYTDPIVEIGDFLAKRIDYALRGGIAAERIIIDPGMGSFISTRHEVSWEVLARLDELIERFAPFPLLIGTSRKGFLGGPLSGRDPLSQLTALAAAEKGASVIRTHEPAMMRSFIDAWRLLNRQEAS